MARLSYACRGVPRDANDEITIREEHIDIFKQENLTEHFLCDVNGFGEVPTLVPVNGKPIPDSVDITLYLAQWYPSLLPAEHSIEIERLLKRLHEINFFSLTFAGKPELQLDNIRMLRERLEEDISERYRAAILVKIKRVEEKKIAAVTEDEVENNINRTTAFMKEVEAILRDSQTGWCCGLDRPSALDTHLLVFIARLQDVKRDSLIPETVKEWADNFMQSDEWKHLMQGRRTVPQL